jgi:hypothetical protein
LHNLNKKSNTAKLHYERLAFAPQRRKERKARFVCFCHDKTVIVSFFGFLCVLCVFAVQILHFPIVSFALLQKKGEYLQGKVFYG